MMSDYSQQSETEHATQADRNHVWHHLTQHKPFEEIDPLMIVEGKGLFVGLELVKDRQTREPVDESVLMKIAADCMAQGVIIGRTNRSFRDLNNTLCLSPALISRKQDLDEIVQALDNALAGISA
jgi:taurine-pyruvate aminotransferase